MDLPPAELQRCKECFRPLSQSSTFHFLLATWPAQRLVCVWTLSLTELEKRIRFTCTTFRNTCNKLPDLFFTLPPGSKGPSLMSLGKHFCVYSDCSVESKSPSSNYIYFQFKVWISSCVLGGGVCHCWSLTLLTSTRHQTGITLCNRHLCVWAWRSGVKTGWNALVVHSLVSEEEWGSSFSCFFTC